MRYDTLISFQLVIPGEYNSNTGNYDKDDIIENTRLASVMDTSTETMNLIYGSIKQGSKTIHIQNHYDEPFDFIVIDKKRYHVDHERRLRVKHTFICSEVQYGQDNDNRNS